MSVQTKHLILIYLQSQMCHCEYQTIELKSSVSGYKKDKAVEELDYIYRNLWNYKKCNLSPLCMQMVKHCLKAAHQGNLLDLC